MKIVSFNVNGIRARLHQIKAVIEQLDPDVIGVQEIKAQDIDFPFAAIEAMGYHAETHGQKGHYGVALLSKKPPQKIQKGFPFDDNNAQKRLITASYLSEKGIEYTVVNGYFPQGDHRLEQVKFSYKKQFYADLYQWLNSDFDPGKNVIVLGDFNVSPTDLDVGIGAQNVKRWLRTGKCGFLPEEREWFEKLESWGLVDSYRYLKPKDNRKFSWFDYRSRGFERDPKRGLRIDTILLTRPLLSRLHHSDISYAIRAMDKPSDHAPVWVSCEAC